MKERTFTLAVNTNCIATKVVKVALERNYIQIVYLFCQTLISLGEKSRHTIGEISEAGILILNIYHDYFNRESYPIYF